MALNINGRVAQLDNRLCNQFLQDFDIVFLSEIKCIYPFKIPGFKSIRSEYIAEESKCGGVAVLISNSLWMCITNVDSRKDEVWFGLSYIPRLLFGALYISPHDSHFYSEQPFASI